MVRIVTLILIATFILHPVLKAQPYYPANGPIFRTDSLPRVDIIINEDSLEWIYDNTGSDQEFRSQFIFTTNGKADTLNEVGFRLRGNTSRHSAKKSFKLSFNTYQPGRKYYGLEKMNLNGEHNDPSVIRSYLTWSLFAQIKVPASRSNHIDLYINNRFYGLYINVEHVDEEFVESRFTNQFGNLYKCLYPANLSYLGTNPDDYKNNGYELKTNVEKDDYSDLINFIHTLDNATPQQLPEMVEPLFNVNNYLRYLAVEIFTGHWDGYTFNKNNYYLYNNPFTGKFEFIPYDVDNTYGIDWFSIDWANRDIYQWWSSGEDRQLTSKIFSNQIYKDRFSFFMNELITKYANQETFFLEIDNTKSKIDASAEADEYRTMDYGWTYSDFNKSYTQALGNHVKYGLKQYLTTRITSIKTQLILNPIAPIVSNVYHNFPQIEENIIIKTDIVDDEANPTGILYYRTENGTATNVSLINEGGDQYKASLPPITQPRTLYYYIEAKDASNNITREPSFGEYSLKIGITDTKLSINEFMAGNTNTIIDNHGEASDWIEIKNTGDVPVNLLNKYLTDDLTDKTKWSFPNVTIEPGEFYLVWADNDPKQGPNHANFKLSQNGESIGLFDSYESNFAAIETLNFTPQDNDISYGKNDSHQLVQQEFITPGGENESADVAFITFHYNMNKQILDGYFNSTTDFVDIAGTFNNWKGAEKIYDGDGDGIYSITMFGFTTDQKIEYKARINANWGTAEFPELGGDGNRKYTFVSGANILSHWYNDQETQIANIEKPSEMDVFPNPAKGSVINVSSQFVIEQVTIFNVNGTILFNEKYSENTILIHHSFEPGIYILQAISSDQILNKKIIIK